MRIGVLGAGQLGRMLGLAARPLDIDCLFLDPAEIACAVAVGKRLRADYDDLAVLDALAAACQAVTLEFENVPVQALRHLEKGTPVYPGVTALATAQDRLSEKQCFEKLGIPVPAYRAVDDVASLRAAAEALGFPFLLKTRRLGYDGKGQQVVRQAEGLDDVLAAFGGAALLAERMVSFEREISILGVRARNGETRFYPVAENVHRGGILRESRPVVGDPRQGLAEDYARRVMDALDFVGVMAFEFFEEQGQLLANEIAPRVHNSGHWTIEGARCSQFENHIRAVAGLPLGSTEAVDHSLMFNLIGDAPARDAVLAIPGAHLHLYGKAARPGRKIGHITVSAEDAEILRRRAALVAPLVEAATAG